jgi:hypothetical protein
MTDVPFSEGETSDAPPRTCRCEGARIAALFFFFSFVLSSSSVAPFAWLNFLFYFLCRGLFAIVFCGVGVGRHVLDATLESGEKKTKKDSVRRGKKK